MRIILIVLLLFLVGCPVQPQPEPVEFVPGSKKDPYIL